MYNPELGPSMCMAGTWLKSVLNNLKSSQSLQSIAICLPFGAMGSIVPWKKSIDLSGMSALEHFALDVHGNFDESFVLPAQCKCMLGARSAELSDRTVFVRIGHSATPEPWSVRQYTWPAEVDWAGNLTAAVMTQDTDYGLPTEPADVPPDSWMRSNPTQGMAQISHYAYRTSGSVYLSLPPLSWDSVCITAGESLQVQFSDLDAYVKRGGFFRFQGAAGQATRSTVQHVRDACTAAGVPCFEQSVHCMAGGHLLSPEVRLIDLPLKQDRMMEVVTISSSGDALRADWDPIRDLGLWQHDPIKQMQAKYRAGLKS